MIRRPRRTVPAVIVAVILLAIAVVVVWSCVQILLGHAPVLPFAAIAAAGATLTAASVAVLVTAGVLVVLGLILIIVAAWPGRPTVLALAARPDVTAQDISSRQDMDKDMDPPAAAGTTVQPVSGATRRSIRNAVAAAASGVDGIDHVVVKVAARSLTATVHTPLRSSTELSGQVRDAVTARLDDIGLARPLRVRVRTNTTRTAGGS